MADEQLGALIDLSIEQALADISTLGDRLADELTAGSETFTEAMAEAIGAVPDVTITPDVTEVAPALEEAVTGSDTTAVVEADASAVPDEVSAAVDSADSTVAVDADVSEAASAIEGLADDVTPIDVPVEVDTADAEGQLDDLANSATGASSSLSNAAAGSREFGSATNVAAATAGIAAGSTSELSRATDGLSGGWGAAATGGFAFAGALGVIFNAGVDSTGAVQRFNATLGDTAPAVEQINVGNLNRDLGDLAITLGTDDEALMNTAASLFQFAKNSGASDKQADQFTERLVALAARAVALNPALGSVADVADQMAVRLQRGGRFAASFGLDLNAADIAQRAMTDSGKQNVAELSIYEKSAAAAEIATQRYGGSIDQAVNRGAANAVIQQRSLREELNNVIEAAGRQVVVPLFGAIEAGLPVVGDFAAGVAQVAVDVLPVFITGLEAIEPPLHLLVDLLDLVGPAIGPVTAGFITWLAVTEGAPRVIGLLVTGIVSLVEAAPAAAAAIGITTTAVEAAEEGMLAVLGPVGLIAGGLAIAASAFGLFGGGADEGSQDLDGFSSSIEKANGLLDETATKAAASLIKERGQTDDLASAGVHLSDVLRGTAAAGAGQRDVLGQISQLTDQLSASQTNLNSESSQGRDVTADLTKRRQELIDTLSRENPALGAVVAALLKEDSTNSGVIGTLTDLSAKHSEATEAARNAAKAGTDEASAAEASAAANTSAAAGISAADEARVRAQAGQKAFRDEVAATQQTFVDAALASYSYALGLGDATAAENALKAAGDALNTTLDLLLGRFLSADQAENAFHEGLLALGDTLFANGFAFDENTKAGLENRDALDQLAEKASSAASAILKSTGDVGQAVVPLQELRDNIQQLRDKLAAAGQDTGFEDTLLGQIDRAIAGVEGKQPAMAQAGLDVSKAGAIGGSLASIDWEALGAFLATQAAQSASDQTPAWSATGAGLAGAGAASLSAALGQWVETGTELGTGGHTGVSSTLGGWIGAGAENAAGAVAGAASQAGAMHGAGTGVGYGGTTGLSQGLAGMPGVASGSVLDSVNAAALAGANAHNVGYGIGTSFVEGIADGANADRSYLAGTLADIVASGVAAAKHAAGISSPSKVFAREVGLPIAQGIAVGISSGAELAAVATSRLVENASSPFSPNLGAGALGGGVGPGGAVIMFNIQVSGVQNPAVAREVGDQIGNGAADALARRGVVVQARVGG